MGDQIGWGGGAFFLPFWGRAFAITMENMNGDRCNWFLRSTISTWKTVNNNRVKPVLSRWLCVWGDIISEWIGIEQSSLRYWNSLPHSYTSNFDLKWAFSYFWWEWGGAWNANGYNQNVIENLSINRIFLNHGFIYCVHKNQSDNFLPPHPRWKPASNRRIQPQQQKERTAKKTHTFTIRPKKIKNTDKENILEHWRSGRVTQKMVNNG